MDITLLPPSTILSNHSHHLYHALPLPLLPSALPRNTGCTHTAISPYRRYPLAPRPYEPHPPSNGRSPITELPDELVLEIFKYLDWKQLLPLQRTCRRFSNLAKSGSLHHSISIGSVPPIPLPITLTRVLPHIRDLHLSLSPYPTSSGSTASIMTLLDSIPPDQLLSLSLPFSASYLSSGELGRVVQRIGGKLEKLDLRGSAISGKGWLDWINSVGRNGRGLRELDLGFTNITELPALPLNEPVVDTEAVIDNSLAPAPVHAFRILRTLSLASCTSLSPSTIYTFLSTLPPSLATLDISRLEQTSFEALKNMCVINDDSTTALREVKVVGIDHLTRLDIRKLKYHWEEQRQACSTSGPGETMSGNSVYGSRVWGEPRTPESQMDRMSISASTPDSLPRLSSSYGSDSGPSSLGSNSSFGGMTDSPRLLTPDNSFDSPHERGMKHPFLTDLHKVKGQDQGQMQRIGKHSPCSIPIPMTGPGRKAEQPKETDDGIQIVHSAILESEDEAGYRQFIGEVAGGTVGLGQGYGPRYGHGHELGMRWLNGA